MTRHNTHIKIPKQISKDTPLIHRERYTWLSIQIYTYKPEIFSILDRVKRALIFNGHRKLATDLNARVLASPDFYTALKIIDEYVLLEIREPNSNAPTPPTK